MKIKCSNCKKEFVWKYGAKHFARSKNHFCSLSCVSRKHGKRGEPEWQIWSQMKQRCSNPNNKQYKNYGARGITVCDRWKDSFANFYEDMGKRPDNHSIDRIDNDKGYSPDNCKWIPNEEQSKNRRTVTLINGMLASEYARINKVYKGTFYRKLKDGWQPEEIVRVYAKSS